jgi:ElaB/YqjD/DUF883 family membrane-anchored ribosome-binding protein
MARARQNDIESTDDNENNEMGELLSSVEELLSTTASVAGAEVDAVREKLKQQLQAARRRGRASRWESEARRAYYSALNGADECIHKHPWEVSTIALVGGILLGACLGSSRRY